jgi:hypothetical protein
MNTHTLRFPITIGTEKITAVTLRRPTVEDVMIVNRESSSAPEVEVRLVSRLSGLPPATIGALDMQDYRSVQAILAAMMAPAG